MFKKLIEKFKKINWFAALLAILFILKYIFL